MKRVLSRSILAQIENASQSLRRGLDASASSLCGMRRFRLALGAGGGLLKSGKPRRLDPKRKTTAPLSAKAEKHSIPQTPRTELRTVPGVGPKNEQLLCAKGIVSLDGLRSVFREQCEEEDTRFIEYLLQEIGIRHRHHCKSIAGFLKPTPETALTQDSERITLCVEGNISAGKSTLMNWFKDCNVELSKICEVVPEPVAEWQKVGGIEGNNILARYYEDPRKHAYAFQNYVFFTRMDVNRRTFTGTKPLRLLERSVFSDRLVFVRAVHENKWMDDCELEMYDSWFNPMLKEIPGLIPDGFIYLRAEPDTCMKRLKQRDRTEENTVTPAYLEGLHEKHEDWFKKQPPMIETKLYKIQRELLIPDKGEILEPEIAIPPELEGSIIWLGQSGILGPDGAAFPSNGNGSTAGRMIPHDVRSAVSDIPALVLDCNDDVDVVNNLDAKRAYARKVEVYYSFVKAYSQRQRRSARFYGSQRAEALRQRWHLVDALSEEEVQAMYDKLLAQMKEQGQRMKVPA